MNLPGKKNKYHNRKVVIDGITFASGKEAKRYGELKILEKAGFISEMRMQVPFELIPRQGKEGAVKYIADFTYLDKDGNLHVEDTKGFRTKEYIIKRKLMLFMKGIKIEEI